MNRVGRGLWVSIGRPDIDNIQNYPSVLRHHQGVAARTRVVSSLPGFPQGREPVCLQGHLQLLALEVQGEPRETDDLESGELWTTT